MKQPNNPAGAPVEKRVLKIFVSSPGDVSDARDAAEDTIAELDDILGDMLGVELQCLRWEKKVPPRMGRPQEVVSEAMDPARADIFVGILWKRFGTPTGNKNAATGDAFGSGTEEEFTLAYEAWKERGSPRILFYRCTRSSDPLQEDVEQVILVDRFFEQFAPSGKTPGLVKAYSEIQAFRKALRRDLVTVIEELAPVVNSRDGTALGYHHRQEGFAALFTRQQNEKRNDAKKEAILAAAELELLALNGYSYLALHGHRFRDQVENYLERGGTFRAFILNPWSPTGVARSGALKPDQSRLSARHRVEAIKASTSYRVSFANVIEGFNFLSSKYKGQVDVRVLNDDVPATVLRTDKVCFFEPYLASGFEDRLSLHMNTFEIQCAAGSYFFEQSAEYLRGLSSRSIGLADFLRREEEYIRKYRETKERT